MCAAISLEPVARLAARLLGSGAVTWLAPLLLIIMAAEAWVLHRRRSSERYRRGSLLSALGCFLCDVLVNVPVRAGFLAAYALLTPWALFDWSDVPTAAWCLAVLGYDLSYYWFHRLSHRIPAMWAAHVVHHQGEQFNLSLPLRQGTITTWFALSFLLPLALLGVPLSVFVAVQTLVQAHQFLTHTEALPRLGPLEHVLMTPRHHRVHHGRDAWCHDKNFGGLLIIWDRLFGTFLPHDAPVPVGTSQGLERLSPWWANTHAYRKLWRDSRGLSLRERRKVWLGT